jgi:poly(hydroxyalkanoate) depolymerase family esterase
MRNLSDTISRLTAVRGLASGKKTSAIVDRLGDLSEFGANPGALRARTYLPAGLRDNTPLVVVLHGCTQTAAAYDYCSGWSRLADQQGIALLFPEQIHANNPNLCFNWFLRDDTRRDSGEALSIRQMIETLIANHSIDRRRVFITGLSAGGAMALAMLAAYPDVFAGGAILAGLPYGCASNVPEAFDRMRGHGGPGEHTLQSLVSGASAHTGAWPTLSLWHGTADHTVDPGNMEAIIGQWRAVLQVARAPTYTAAVDGFPRRVWRNAEGREVIEAFSITGMGHGAPLATGGADGYGASAPFMLDVGISSTLQIARFWKIAPSAEARAPRQAPASGALAPTEAPLALSAESAAAYSRPDDGATSQPPPERVTGVRKVIEDALRAAGLMR